MSFNVCVDLAGFQAIVPCGLVGEPVASLQTILGDAGPTVTAARDGLARHFQAVCQRPLTMFNADGPLPPALQKVFES
jgi:lipoyl(octanoyl) transferase